MKTYTINFLPHDKTIQVPAGETLIRAAIEAGVHVNASCGGEGVCGKCRVIIEGGAVDGGTSDRLSDDDLEKGYRLACQSIVREGVTVRVPVEPGLRDSLTVALERAPVFIPEVVVPAGDRGPGIMQRVIERKREWHPALESWEADAYTRVVMSNDTTIVSISESLSTLYWDREKGFREVLHAKRQTENTDTDMNMASARMTPNLYDDDIDILGNDVIGVTHPNALDYYTFTLEGIRYRDDRKVFDIRVEPNTLQPAFEGRVAVLDSAFTLLEVAVKPGKMIMLPPPLNRFTFTIEQQFSDFDGRFWLPVDVRMSGSLKLKLPGLEFPLIQVRQATRFTEVRFARDPRCPACASGAAPPLADIAPQCASEGVAGPGRAC